MKRMYRNRCGLHFSEAGDNTSGKKHGDDRSQSDADNMAAENQTDQTGNADAEEIKTVFSEAEVFFSFSPNTSAIPSAGFGTILMPTVRAAPMPVMTMASIRSMMRAGMEEAVGTA